MEHVSQARLRTELNKTKQNKSQGLNFAMPHSKMIWCGPKATTPIVTHPCETNEPWQRKTRTRIKQVRTSHCIDLTPSTKKPPLPDEVEYCSAHDRQSRTRTRTRTPETRQSSAHRGIHGVAEDYCTLLYIHVVEPQKQGISI